MKEDESMEKIYIIKNLDCAHCGSKIEEAISAFDEIDGAALNFPLKKEEQNQIKKIIFTGFAQMGIQFAEKLIFLPMA